MDRGRAAGLRGVGGHRRRFSELPAGIDTGIRFVTTDADAEHASMAEQGVDVDEVLRWPEVPPMFSFRDIDGNTFYLAEPGV